MHTTERLLRWYERSRRSLPWRGRSDPYEIWVSEVMLQQTRSATVEGYYERFLERFPDVEGLAGAEEEEVLAAWSGLGYYRRARQMHAAARIVAERGGQLPESVDELEELPGIGAYTAAAIASLAFGVAVPVVDGNVERVLSRFLALSEPVRSAAGRRRLLEVARRLLDDERPGDFNQAVMELGALVCVPRNPACDLCPLAEQCEAHRAGEEERYPVAAKRRPIEREEWVAVVVRRRQSVLLARRADGESLLGGFWELPWIRVGDDEAASRLARRYGGRWTVDPAAGRVRHSLTHRALEVSVHAAEWIPDEVSESSVLHWVEEDRITDLPTTSLLGKALRVFDRDPMPDGTAPGRPRNGGTR